MPLPAIFKTSFGALLLASGVGLLGWGGAACGSSSGGTFTAGGHDAGTGGPDNGIVDLNDGGFSIDALAAEDPPNQWCGPDADETGAELNCSATANLAIAEASAVALAAGAVAAASAPVEAALAFGLAGVGLATKTGCVTTALPSSGAFPNGSQNARPRIRVRAVAPAPAPSPIRLGIFGLPSLRRPA